MLRVTFDSKLSWDKHIVHVSNIMKKKIHALRRILSDLNQSELLSIAHGSISSVLYYAAGTWLNGGLHKKIVKKLKVLLKSNRSSLRKRDKNAAMSQVSCKERAKVTKNIISKVGLSQFHNNAHEPILFMKWTHFS